MSITEGRGENVELVQVAFASDRTKAEMIQGLLENDGIPSVLQALGVHGPELGFGTLASSPQRVMVRTSQADRGRALLAGALIENEPDTLPEPADAGGRKPRSYGFIGGYVRIYLWSFGIMAITFGIFLLFHIV